MRLSRSCLCLIAFLVASSPLIAPANGDDIAERAHKLHFSSIVLDTHDDTTQRFFSKTFDIAKRNSDGSIDIPGVRGLKPSLKDDDFLKPDAIAETYWHLAHQDKSAWTMELELRPFKENL